MYQVKLSGNLEDCKIIVSVRDSNDSSKSGILKVEISDFGEIQEDTDVITSEWQKVLMADTPKTGKNHTCTAHLFVDGSEVASDGPKIIMLCA